MPCNIIETDLPGAVILEPTVYEDPRGFFMETYNAGPDSHGLLNTHFVQDNLSLSQQGVIRGLHYQHPSPQGKLVQVLKGEVFDVAVDLRQGSPTFKKWIGVNLSDSNHRQFYLPEGFAHGFAVLSETALFFYKCSDYYAPACERGVNYADPQIDIHWPVETPLLSEKDAALPMLKDIPADYLPKFEG
jgi:dTDP-4-dehydrorhamnose 3,5-epimerase